VKALLINCTLKPSPEKSNTEALAEVVADALREDGVGVAAVRAVDHSIPPLLERMDAMLSEADEEERPVAYNHVVGALGDIGFTIPGQAWTYWNKGPGPGEDYSETEEGHEWSHSTGRAAAANLSVARALEGKPIPAPPSG
jgi:hypothetical protein